MAKKYNDDLIYSQMLRDEDVRDLTKLRIGIIREIENNG